MNDEELLIIFIKIIVIMYTISSTIIDFWDFKKIKLKTTHQYLQYINFGKYDE